MSEQVTLQKALFTIKKLKHLLQDQTAKSAQPIAIVGLSCRFPQAVGKEAYWEMLCKGKNIISKMPDERWNLLKGSTEQALRDDTHPYYGGFLSDIGNFDPYFFGISPREAVRMDPQHRLMLEVAYEAIEDAGFPIEALAGSNTGVFASLYVSQLAHMQEMESDLDALYLPTGNAISIAANRISYLFDLRGPSIILDSACSSSMAALHLACLNLQNKLCDIALVCGAKLNLLPYVNLVLSKAKMLSPDGQCKTFDADANGYAQGEGVGVLVLKPLDKALQDNDRIYAVINGSAVNQDGKTNGLTAPNGLQQEKLLKAAYAQAKIDPTDLSYIECHGTGTFLGDPIEIQALGEVIGKNRDKAKPCWIGSVKTNIGHLEPAAGVAGIIKVALALKNSQIPPHLNFSTPNPHIAFDKYNLLIPTQVEAWPQYGAYRMAGISGFGFGGTNAHIVLRELSKEEKSQANTENPLRTEVFTLSAKDPIALKLLIEKWQQYLTKNPNVDLAQICHNVHLRRSHYSQRLAILANTTAELLERLTQLQNAALENVENSTHIAINLKKESVRTSGAIDIDALKNNPHQLATLYVNRTNIDWKKYEENRRYSAIDLPLYPWQHKHYWPELGHKSISTQEMDTYPLRGKKLISPLQTMQFEFSVNTKNMPDIQDTYNVLHAGYYLEIFAFAIDQLYQQAQFTIENLAFLSPLIVPNDAQVSIQLVLEKITDDNNLSFQVFSHIHGQKNWVEHANGKLILGASTQTNPDSINSIKNRSLINESADKLYKRVIDMGMPAGDSIRWTQQYWLGKNEILCEFQQPKAQRKNEEFKLKVHPGIIDGSIQPLFMLLPEELIKPYIASNVGKIKFFGMQEGPLYLLVRLKDLQVDGKEMICHSCLMNSEGKIIFEAEDVCLTQLDNKFEIQKFMQANTQQSIDLALIPAAERKPVIINFLIDQAAILFAMPREDISINLSLREMGIDSLMALVLMRAIEIGLGSSYSMQDLLQGPSIAELADVIAADGQDTNHSNKPSETKIASINNSHRIAYRQKRADAKVKLFCFPYGGGGASIYREWQKGLPDSIEVCPVQLPGREEKMNEKALNNLSELVSMLIDDLQPEFDLPFAFFGHSFGSLIAFELGRQLRKRNLPQPMHLFASAFPDPRVPAKSLDIMLAQLRNMNLNLFELDQKALAILSDEQLNGLANVFSENGIVGYNDHLMDKEIVKVLLPVFIGDMSLVKSYEYYQDSPLDLPITVFLGTQDTWVSREDHFNWVDHTKQKCEFHEFNSGHLFIKDNQIKGEILQIISRALAVK